MNRSEYSHRPRQFYHEIQPQELAASAGVAAVCVGVIMLMHTVLSDEKPDMKTPPKTVRPTSALRTEDEKLERRRQPLQEGDVGLEIHRGAEMVEFRYTFSLHPLKELPDDQQHSVSLSSFIRRWIEKEGFHEEDWCILPVRVDREIVPDERWFIPTAVCTYKLQSYAIPKAALRPHDGLIAER